METKEEFTKKVEKIILRKRLAIDFFADDYTKVEADFGEILETHQEKEEVIDYYLNAWALDIAKLKLKELGIKASHIYCDRRIKQDKEMFGVFSRIYVDVEEIDLKTMMLLNSQDTAIQVPPPVIIDGDKRDNINLIIDFWYNFEEEGD